MKASSAKLSRNLTRERFSKGDLVGWWKNSNSGRVKEVGIVLSTYPSNVYESESCDVLISGNVLHLEAKYLFGQEQ